MEIRELKAKDVKVLAKMLGKLKSTSVGDLFTVLEKKQPNQLEVGLSIFRVVAADLTDEIFSWFADLLGKTIEELDDMPPNTPNEIIKALVKRGDFKDFFGSAIQRGRKSPTSTTSSR